MSMNLSDLKGTLVRLMNAQPSITLRQGVELQAREPVDVCTVGEYKSLRIDGSTLLVTGSNEGAAIYIVLTVAESGEYPCIDGRLGRPTTGYFVQGVYGDGNAACECAVTTVAGMKFMRMAFEGRISDPSRKVDEKAVPPREIILPDAPALPAQMSASELKDAIIRCGKAYGGDGDTTDWSGFHVHQSTLGGFSSFAIEPNLELVYIPEVTPEEWRNEQDHFRASPGLALAVRRERDPRVRLAFPSLPIVDRTCVALFDDWTLAIFGTATRWFLDRKGDALACLIRSKE